MKRLLIALLLIPTIARAQDAAMAEKVRAEFLHSWHAGWPIVESAS